MAALSINTDRRVTGGITKHLALAAAAIPFQGSLLGINAAGFAVALTAGLPFLGIAEIGVLSRDTPVSNGAPPNVRARTGIFTFVAIIAGVTRADCVARRRVYASTDNDLSLTAEAGNTYIGDLVDLYTQLGGLTNGVVIQGRTYDQQMYGAGDGGLGSQVLADAAATLTVSQLDQILYLPNTAARILTLPPVASCTGRGFTVIKTTAAAFAFTLQGNAAENVNGANTYVSGTAQYSVATIRSDGTQWLVTAKI